MSNRVIDAIRQAREDYHRLKGGSGSGNFGHVGRPGKIGGSVARLTHYGDEVVLVNSPAELKVGSFGQSYFILPEGDERIVDVGRSGDENHAYAAMRLAKYNPKFQVADYKSYSDYTYQAVAQGAIRGRNRGDDSFISLPSLDTTNLQRLQRLVDEGKIQLRNNVRLIANHNDASPGDPPYVNVSYGDVMFAKRLVVTGNTVNLKEV